MIKDIRKKGILLVASILLLLAAGVYLAYAWYTKTTSASQMSFEAARWEYSANFSNDPIQLQICNLPVTYGDESEGVSIVDGKVAPGSEGYAPVRLSAGGSEVAIGYSLSVDKSLMSNEFKERIYFFQDADMKIEAGDNWGDTEGNGRTVMTGVLQPGEEKVVILYWRWVYEASEIPSTVGGRRYTTATDAEFDAFDTKVGMNPDRYAQDMIAQVLISGTQIKPGETISDSPENGSKGGSGDFSIDDLQEVPDYDVPEAPENSLAFCFDGGQGVYLCFKNGAIWQYNGNLWWEEQECDDVGEATLTYIAPVYLPVSGVVACWLDRDAGTYRYATWYVTDEQGNNYYQIYEWNMNKKDWNFLGSICGENFKEATYDN